MKARKRLPILWAGAGYILFMFAAETIICSFINLQQPSFGDSDTHLGRQILSAHGEVIHYNCTPRTIDEFPNNVFMREIDRRKGGVILHIFLVLYMFASLAVVCDDYFVPALEHLCEALKLQPDVAGATFMAAGSSAPELFTSIIGVFFAKSDVGLGTIVGSAVFNVLFIISICGLFSGMVIKLTWWPLTRDILFYFLSIIALMVVIQDSIVTWYEALAMLGLYAVYILMMYFNQRLSGFCVPKVENCSSCCKRPGEPGEAYEMPLVSHGDENGSSRRSSRHTSHHSVETRASSVYSERVGYGTSHKSVLVHDESEDYTSPLAFPQGAAKRVFWFLMLPTNLVYFITIPDCRRSGCWRKLFILTFIMSIAWTAGLSYIMVWMVTIAGDTLGIPDTVLGLTLLAAGTSVPDALASLLVARDGNGDMAVSNSIGSNIFDLLLCLGLPWLLHCTVVSPGASIEINSNGITVTTMIMFGTVVFLLASVGINRWKLDRKLGIIYIVVYFIVIIFACMFEMNVFSKVNLPPCPR